MLSGLFVARRRSRRGPGAPLHLLPSTPPPPDVQGLRAEAGWYSHLSGADPAGNPPPSVPPSSQNLNIQVEDIRIRAILGTYRRRTPVTEGYVEVKDGKTWKQICDKHWTAKNSRVVCGMFGFPGEKTYNTKVYK